jgi:hypothetical protein
MAKRDTTPNEPTPAPTDPNAPDADTDGTGGDQPATPGPDDGADSGEQPAHRKATAKGKGTKAAPLAAPPEPPAEQPRPAVTAAIGAVMDERHLGIVGSGGDQLNLAKVLVKDNPKGTTWRATERIYESTTVPGSERTRRRLLFGQGAVVQEHEHRALHEAVEKRTAATTA